ncbi:hypothetical protein BC831DRAFT_443122 [Entophlyctis helioformis]|nr:hypothetical protein BC831DRAFT_443122 [Entophlyctis helioformis]
MHIRLTGWWLVVVVHRLEHGLALRCGRTGWITSQRSVVEGTAGSRASIASWKEQLEHEPAPRCARNSWNTSQSRIVQGTAGTRASIARWKDRLDHEPA